MEQNIATAVSLAILLWKDATPETTFPPTRELVKIELGRILAHNNLMQSFRWLRSALGPRLLEKLAAEPWQVKPKSLMRGYIASIPDEHKEALGKAIEDSTFEDPAFAMLIRRGNPPRATPERIILTAQRVSKVLGVEESAYTDVEERTRHAYFGLFRQLSR